MKIRRYTLMARPERTVVMVPVVGSRMDLRTLVRIMRKESIPRTATVRVMTSRSLYNTRRFVRFEWPTAAAVIL